jgi:hypothetical protein
MRVYSYVNEGGFTGSEGFYASLIMVKVTG